MLAMIKSKAFGASAPKDRGQGQHDRSRYERAPSSVIVSDNAASKQRRGGADAHRAQNPRLCAWSGAECLSRACQRGQRDAEDDQHERRRQ